MSDEKRVQLELGALWAKKTKAGDEFWSGSLNNLNITVWRNTRKTKDNQPDFRVFLSEKPKQRGPDERQQSSDEGFGF